MKTNEYNSSKLVMYIILAVAVTFLIAYALFVYMPNHSKARAAEDYKKALYQSMVCQYGCDLTEQDYLNKTQLLPDADCVKNCTIAAKEAMNSSENLELTTADLQTDNLFVDMSQTINLCKKDVNKNETDNSAFFSCVYNGLNELGTKYSYLND